MLADIEDPIAKLKILKSLISNVINDTDIIQILQDEIDRLKETPDPEEIPIEDPVEGEEGMEGPGGDIGGDMSDIGIEDTDVSEEGSEDGLVLPNPEDLGIDLTNADAE